MRSADVFVHALRAGTLIESADRREYRFVYEPDYHGPPVSLRMPVREKAYVFDRFPAFFDGLLPEGSRLEALLVRAKLDRDDLLGQLIRVGHDTVGAVTVAETASVQ